MRQGNVIVRSLAGMVVGAAFLPWLACAQDADTPHPYEPILLRNAFGLKAPPPPPAHTNSAVQESLPELTLTGIADFSLKKWALLVAAERGKPPRNYTLSEGQEVDGLEVFGIDARAGTVHVRLKGTEMTLSFKAQDQKQVLARAEEKRFVDEHIRAHALRELREAERRARERGETPNQNQNL